MAATTVSTTACLMVVKTVEQSGLKTVGMMAEKMTSMSDLQTVARKDVTKVAKSAGYLVAPTAARTVRC